MPTNRRYRTRGALVLGAVEREHLLIGGAEHLLAGPCWICENGIETARSTWQAHRASILAARTMPFPCYASIVFDGAKLPEPDPDWPDFHRQMHGMIAAASPPRA